jgi:hypothetical protein
MEPVGPDARPEWVAAALARGEHIDDAAFDRFLPEAARRVSGQFWSPLHVALRVASWAGQLRLEHIVDVGSGAGKLCVAAALACRSRFTGFEQRPALVAAARDLAALFGVADRVRFLERTLARGGVPEADGYYLFNPFEENLHGPSDHIDETVPLGHTRFDHDVALTEELLATLRPGKCVILYNGFGGEIPSNYERLRVGDDPLRPLELWKKSGKIEI